MWSLFVVVSDVGLEHALEVPTTVDQDVVKALSAHGPHEPRREGIRPRRPDRRSDDADALRAEHRIEGSAVHDGPVAQEEGRLDRRSSMARFLACWVTHAESGRAVTPAGCTRRVASSMQNRT
jgi:hypothetical protein